MALACLVPACQFQAPDPDPAVALQDMINHVAAAHPAQIPGGAAPAPLVRPPALTRPSIDIGCSPAQWADFLKQ